MTAVVAPGVSTYFTNKIESAENAINVQTQNLRRLEAQRNALNARGTTCLISPRSH